MKQGKTLLKCYTVISVMQYHK